MTHLVDIAICTFNRCHYLQQALDALLPQLPDDGSVRVLLVDNNSTDDTPAIAQALAKTDNRVLHLHCAMQGLSHARNMALETTTATWLAFLDDDAEPSADWVAQLLRLTASGKFDAFGGVYRPWFAEGRKPWFRDKYECNDKPGQEEEFRLKEGYFSGGIAAYRVDLLRKAGGFPVDIGMKGKTVAYGEETCAQRQMAIAGARLGFSRRWTMRHLVPMRKQRWQWAWQRQYALGRDFWITLGKQTIPALLRHYLAIEARQAARDTWRAIRGLRHGNRPSNLMYESARWARLWGLWRGYRMTRRAVDA